MKDLAAQSHDGRELEFMLAEQKPLAMFHDIIFAGAGEDEIDRSFAGFVEQGRFVRHEDRDLWEDPQTINGRTALGTRVRLFALRDQKWRIDAYLLLARAAKGHPWNDALERLVGLLLGYTEEETSAWVKHLQQLHGGWGAVPVYLAVTDKDLEKIRQLGFRALPMDLVKEPLLLLCSAAPTAPFLKSVLSSEPTIMLRFGLNARFSLALPFEPADEGRIVRLSKASIPEVNLNMKSNLEIVRQGGDWLM
ncbi:hypothetical protein [Reyranella soli]|uniref:Uncharacterized protein n=1 Tax=Reyranella soli TaxID=1230389 RepID=A0A512NRT8_9HYPH|nr:hypothetical protein [Reyranella soli]GEP61665.1 hypothetical protein RSO01_88310 [Reyranella soli]